MQTTRMSYTMTTTTTRIKTTMLAPLILRAALKNNNNKLQDNKNRRMVNTDAKLKAVFGGKGQVSMFEIAKYLGKHLS